MTATDETPDLPEAAAETPGSGPGPGERLRGAREALGLAVDDIARELHLETFIVQAIERDNLDVLGAPVFVKGYLRGYARRVGLPEQEIVDAWTPADSAAGQLRSMPVAKSMKAGTSLSMFVLWVALGLLVLAVAVYLLSGNDAGEAAATDSEPRGAAATAPAPKVVLRENFVVPATTASPDAVAATSAPANEVSAGAQPDSPATSARSVATDDPPRVAGATVVEATTAGGPVPAGTDEAGATDAGVSSATPTAVAAAPLTVNLQLSFDEECWIELADARRRLLYGLEKPGSVRSFAAEPPLRFFVGNVDGVRIRLDDADYRVPDAVRTGRNTARFVVSASDIGAMQ